MAYSMDLRERVAADHAAVAPAAFRTNGRPTDGPDGDSTGKSGRSFVAAHTGIGDAVTQQVRNTHLSLLRQGRVFRINNGGGSGFELSQMKAAELGWHTVHGEQWLSDRDDGIVHEVFALAAPKTTDVLRLRPKTIPAGLYLDPSQNGSALRAAYYSAATMLVRAAAVQLDIDPEEIEIAAIHTANQNAGEIFLADHLANGAGFVTWIRDNWESLLEGIVNRTGRWAKGVIPCCTSACYRCMLGYRNRQLHGLLDWRLGYDLLRIMYDASYRSGLDGQFDASPSLKGWLGTATRLRDEFIRFLPGATASSVGDLPAVANAGITYLITHPFWSPAAAEGVLAPAAATRAVDTFNLARRMAWCRIHLQQFPEIRPQTMPAAAPAPATPPVDVSSIVSGVEFDLPVKPPGMPAGRNPRFRRLGAGEQPSIQGFYLVQGQSGEHVVGRVQLQQLVGGGNRLRCQPGNHLDGVRSFDWDAAEPQRILAVLVS